jgi:hypothetical protein
MQIGQQVDIPHGYTLLIADIWRSERNQRTDTVGIECSGNLELHGEVCAPVLYYDYTSYWIGEEPVVIIG